MAQCYQNTGNRFSITGLTEIQFKIICSLIYDYGDGVVEDAIEDQTIEPSIGQWEDELAQLRETMPEIGDHYSIKPSFLIITI